MPSVTVQAASTLEIKEIAVATQSHDEVSPPPLRSLSRGVQRAGTILALTLLAILVDGYHPYSEDAGIYVASLKQLASAGMYPVSGAFIAPYVRLSLFSHFGAWLLRMLHLPLEAVLFQIHIATVFLLLYGSYEIARRCFRSHRAAWGGTLLVALCLCVPVAGTSLSIADPYLTGRSFSTPFTLFAICAALDKSIWRMCLFLLLAAIFHPLMGAYAIGFLLVLWTVESRSWLRIGAVAAVSLLAAAFVQFSRDSDSESPAHLAAVATRTYFFLSEWRWYELLGIVAPLALLSSYALWQKNRSQSAGPALVTASVVMGLISLSISVAFCHPQAISQSIAALQPLRPFLFIYLVLFLVLGGLVGEFLLQSSVWRWLALTIVLGASLGYVQHTVYPGSPQVELPGVATHNPWHQAFNWVRSSTPRDAIFALDANYIDAPAEDSLGFRAVAERDSLADRSKDGGAAAVFPQLADRWLTEQTATTNLNLITDAERLRRLSPFHVSWIVLNHDARTSFLCPFTNEAVKVCQLR
ncbi:hypothetical protein HDF16_002589 [Granulicella aggregans]|uniref:4-amino-4-deoxy-L-arabinose transferase-like glycosyltransferase n=1 Tax=Granulicella aggregans TaxID=474949 RepID=A0A7W7ZDS6_9BACT|nr:hypothetical protein [Granulicella aggregans]MBB5057883.1 hypothetical protein [Granulicella aggregans]